MINIPEHAFSEVLINPKIVSHSREQEEMIEGCLSFPNIFIKVKRWNEVNIIFQDLSGKTKHYRSTSKLISQCIQHEIDHLDGILFIEKLNQA